MFSHVDRLLLSVLIDCAVKSCVVLLMAGVATALLRRSAATVRHRVLATAVAAVLVLPILSCVMPKWTVAVPVHARASRPVVASTPLEAASVTPGSARFAMPYAMAPPFMAPGMVKPGGRLSDTSDRSDISDTLPAPMAPIARRIVWRPTASGVVCVIWLLGAMLLLGRMTAGLRALALLSRGSRPFDGPPLTTDMLNLPTNVALRISERSAVPITWGLFRPAILIPVSASTWPEERLRWVILHEAAHIRRGDWLIQMLTECACCLYWFNPMVWLAGARLRMEAEHACDDAVLTQGASPTDYATHLLEVAQSLRGRRTASAAVSMASRASIQGRLTAIIDGTRNRSVPAPRMMGIAVCLSLLAALPVGAFHLAFKQVSPTSGVTSAAPTNAPGQNPTVTLPNGVTVELQGQVDTENGQLGDYWWSVDGTTIPSPAGAAADRVDRSLLYGIYGRSQSRLLAFKLTSPQALQCSTCGYVVVSANARYGYDYTPDFRLNSPVLAPGQPLIESAVTGFPSPSSHYYTDAAQSIANSAKHFTYRFGVAAGPWNTVSSQPRPLRPAPSSIGTARNPDGTFGQSLSLALEDDPRLTYLDAGTHRYRSALLLPYTSTGMLGNVARRVIALDIHGKELPLRETVGPQSINFVNPTYSPIYTIPAGEWRQIATLVVQTRPYQWAEFKDIAVNRIPTAAAPLPPPDIAPPDLLPGYSAQASGVTVGVMALAEPRSEGGRWWRPDGSLLVGQIANYKMMMNQISSLGNGSQTRLVMIGGQSAGQPPASMLRLDLLDESGQTIGTLQAQAYFGGLSTVQTFPSGERTFSIRCGIAANTWRSVATLPFNPSQVRHQGAGRGDYTPDVQIIMSSLPELTYATRNGGVVTRVFPTANLDPDKVATQIVAIMRDGEAKPIERFMGSQNGISTIGLAFDPNSMLAYTSYTTDDGHKLDLADVKAFELQTCPYRWFEIKNIAVNPRPASHDGTKADFVKHVQAYNQSWVRKEKALAQH